MDGYGQVNRYPAQEQLGAGVPIDPEEFPSSYRLYGGRHRSHTFVQPLVNPMFHGLAVEPVVQPREPNRPRNSFDYNDPCMEMNHHGH